MAGWSVLPDHTMFSLVMMKCKIFILVLVTGLAPVSKAQYRWQATHLPITDSGEYFFTTLSGRGNLIIAGGNVEPDTNLATRNTVRRILLRSIDGGRSWEEHDPEVPPWRTASGLRSITSIYLIDSLNIMAVGDSDVLLRSEDGGNSWQSQVCDCSGAYSDVHFSDQLSGVISCWSYDIARRVFVTSDGGEHWTAVPVRVGPYGIAECEHLGNGHYRLMEYGSGKIFTTLDEWMTIDSTAPMALELSDSSTSVVVHYRATGDTIIGYGVTYVTSPDGLPRSDPRALIVRSTDNGKNWRRTVWRDTVRIELFTMTAIDRDTIIAAGRYYDKYLISTDRGQSWQQDTMTFDSSISSGLVRGAYLTPSGNIVFATHLHPASYTPSYLLLGVPHGTSNVESYERIVYNTFLYPNPATDRVTIRSVDTLHEVHVFDILGREMTRATIPATGELTLDLKRFACGVYQVLLDHNGNMLPVGKLSVLPH